jgi:tRNA modification GTPase
MQRLLKRCLELGARLAEPGEFTRRAFLNDKLDLAQAESVADLIDAASEEAAKSAIRSLQGEFSRAIHEIVDSLINLRMLVEACIDFPDEDVDFLEAADALGKLRKIETLHQHLLANARQGRLLREGTHVVLVGQPNVGKSSLLNQLAGDEIAIVTPIAGTTRDTVREEIEISGVPFHIIDTAGLRETSCEVEQIGINRTWAAVEKASLALLLLDAREGVTPSDQSILSRLPSQLPVLQVFNKIDLVSRLPNQVEKSGDVSVYVSAKRGDGMDILHDRLLSLAGWQQTGEGAFMARERHIRALELAAMHIGSARKNCQQLEFFAEELKLAQVALSSITGEFSADDLLGEIFSRFCIGK